MGNEHDGKNADGHGEHGEFSARVDREAALHEDSGEGAAGDGADRGEEIDGDQEPVLRAQVEPVVSVEELRQIKEIEPPDAVGEAFGRGKGPGAAFEQQREKARLLDFSGWKSEVLLWGEALPGGEVAAQPVVGKE